MFKNIEQDIKTYSNNTAELERISNDIVLERRYWKSRIEHWNEFLSNEDLLNAAVIESAVASVENKAPQILLDEAQMAIESTPEFTQSPLFWARLQDAILNEDTIYVTHVGGNNIEVTIDLEYTAGTLDEYVEGVLYAREALEEEYPRKKDFDPKKASQKWRQIYEAGGTFYNKIINWRMSAFGNRAPFWVLINDGVPQDMEAVDRGGTPYPVSKPTRFKQKAERKISQLIVQELKEQRRDWPARAREEREYAREAVRKMEELFELATAAIIESAPKFKAAEEKVVDQLEEYGEDRFERADPEKLNALIAEISAGKADPTRRYYIQRAGEKPIRVRVKDIIRRFNLEIDKK